MNGNKLLVMKRLRKIGGRILAVFFLSLVMMGMEAAAVTRWVNDDDPNGGGYVPPGTSCADPGYATIQAAINDAAISGDIIMVCAGTYMENINLAKSLTLLGAQASVDACGRVAVGNESIVTPPLLNPASIILELDTGSAGSIINGFTFQGGTRAILSDTGPIDNLQILNNRIRQFTGNGVFLDDTGINITANQNEIDGTNKIGTGALFHLDTDNFDGFWFTNNCVANGITATGFFVDGARNVDNSTAGSRLPMFTGNFIDNNQTGANLGRGAWGDGPISSNTFSNNVFDGLQGGPKNSLITLNTFDDNGRHGFALTSFSNVNPNFSGPGMTAGAQGNNINHNCFTANGFTPPNGAGIFFSATQFPGTISTNLVNQNNIAGNFIGAQYLGPETINAEFNWWGSPTGPTHPSNPGGTGDSVVDNGPAPGGIDFMPFLPSDAGGTPCSPPPSGKVTGGGQVDVPGGKGTFGFNAKQEDGVASGHLNYKNHVSGAHLNCTVTAVTMLTATTAEFSGTCSADSAAPSFMVHAEDNGEPGKNVDRFIITYGPTEGGTLRSGNIQIHK